MKILTLIALFALLGASCKSIAQCEDAAYGQFDFWLGEWTVHSAQGKLAGHNHISKQMDGCVVKEKYRTAHGYYGESLNIYDRASEQWHQTWVDNSGLLLSLWGQFDGQAMVLSGTGKNQQGQVLIHRISWMAKDDGSVRQHWQTSIDKGQTWQTLFDGIYTKTTASAH